MKSKTHWNPEHIVKARYFPKRKYSSIRYCEATTFLGFELYPAGFYNEIGSYSREELEEFADIVDNVVYTKPRLVITFSNDDFTSVDFDTDQEALDFLAELKTEYNLTLTSEE